MELPQSAVTLSSFAAIKLNYKKFPVVQLHKCDFCLDI